MIFDERFISEEEALKFCMERSVEALSEYKKVLDTKEITLQYSNCINTMPKILSATLWENLRGEAKSRLFAHVGSDIARNIADIVVMDKAREALVNDSPLQIAFDRNGDPVGDAAMIVTEVLEGMNSISEGLGENANLTVEPSRVQFFEVGNTSSVITPTGVHSMTNNAASTYTSDKVQ